MPTIYKMTVNNKRYKSVCSKCNGRIRVGRSFVIDTIDSKLVYHVQCWKNK